MNTKIIITYLIVYILLNSIGVCIAFHFWWTDSLNLSSLTKESLSLLMSVGFCWIGILYLSILIVRKFIVKINNQQFIGPIDLASNEMYQKEIGVKNATKFKNSLTFVAFAILILSIIAFITSMNSYEVYELSIYGKVEKVKVKKIRNDVKKKSYIFFEYNNSKNETNLWNEKKLKAGDEVIVVYSIKNPKIINYANE